MNRFTILATRTRKYALAFTVTTISFFILGICRVDGSLVTPGQIFIGLADYFLIAAGVMWFANGFAWAHSPEEPVDTNEYSIAGQVFGRQNLN